MIIEKFGQYGIKRVYVTKIKCASAEEIRKVFVKHVRREAQIKTDKWSSYANLKEYNIMQEKSEPKKNFKLTHRFIQGLKSWMRAIYHHVSDEYFQTYLDEYCYRFNRNNFKKGIFENLIQRMTNSNPIFYFKNYKFSNNI